MSSRSEAATLRIPADPTVLCGSGWVMQVPGSHQESSTWLPQEHKPQKGNARAESCLIARNGSLELESGHQMEGEVCGAGHRVGASRKVWRSDRCLLSAFRRSEPRKHLRQVWRCLLGCPFPCRRLPALSPSLLGPTKIWGAINSYHENTADR